jgi:hypothetical protein
MDARSLEMVHRVLVVQGALLGGVVEMLPGALRMMRRVDVGPGAVLGQVGLVLAVKRSALALVLAVHGRMSFFMARVERVQRAMSLPVALVFRCS